MRLRFTSRSAAETKKIGRHLGKCLVAGDVVALCGHLGSGKTTLAKGIAGGLGIPEHEIASPSFTLIREHAGREKMVHIDWYRLDAVKGPDERFALECFSGDTVTLVEWADRARRLFPRRHLWIEMTHAGPSSRKIEITAKPEKDYEDVLNEMARFRHVGRTAHRRRNRRPKTAV